MIDLRLRYQGGGTFQTATKLDYDLAVEEFGQGELLRAKVSKPKSQRQNAYFHALVEAAFDNQRGGPKLPTWRHLKSHVLIEAGYCQVERFERGSLTPEVAQALRRQFETVDFTVDRKSGEILMKTAKRVRDATAEEMSDILDKTIAYICTVIVPGMDPDSIMNMARSKAA